MCPAFATLAVVKYTKCTLRAVFCHHMYYAAVVDDKRGEGSSKPKVFILNDTTQLTMHCLKIKIQKQSSVVCKPAGKTCTSNYLLKQRFQLISHQQHVIFYKINRNYIVLTGIFKLVRLSGAQIQTHMLKCSVLLSSK